MGLASGPRATLQQNHKIKRGETPHLVLPNPDLIYPERDGYGFASAIIARMFEAALALKYPGRTDLTFTELGKPHPALFEKAIHRAGTKNMVMIGDTPTTDIRGANNIGIASALFETADGSIDLSTLPELDKPMYLIRSLAH